MFGLVKVISEASCVSHNFDLCFCYEIFCYKGKHNSYLLASLILRLQTDSLNTPPSVACPWAQNIGELVHWYIASPSPRGREVLHHLLQCLIRMRRHPVSISVPALPDPWSVLWRETSVSEILLSRFTTQQISVLYTKDRDPPLICSNYLGDPLWTICWEPLWLLRKS